MNYPQATEQNTLRMDKEQCTMFIQCVMLESEKPEFKVAYEKKEGDPELGFLAEIVYRRVKVRQLPIGFTLPALLSINAFVDNPGKAVVLLIDCLNKYEGQLITTEELAEVYPSGFYKDGIFEDIVENFMKPRKHKWSEIY